LKCTRSSVSQWEDGTNEPRAARLRQLAQLYNVPHEWLAHGDEAAAVIRDVVQVSPDDFGGALRTKIKRMLSRVKRSTLWRVESEMMAGWHLTRGVFIVVEEASTARPRDVVIVEYGTKGHLLRVYLPPYLYALPLRAQPAPLIVGGTIEIIGVVRKIAKVSHDGLEITQA
jgi:SOS-response transcriptional repressor LexA